MAQDTPWPLPRELADQVRLVIEQCPQARPVFERVVSHLLSVSPSEGTEPTAKKRKLDDSTPKGLSVQEALGPVINQVPDLGFLVPLRKKCILSIHESLLAIQIASSAGQPEAVLPIADIQHAFCLPTPNKQRPHFTVILFKFNPVGSISSKETFDAAPETFAFGFDDKAPTEKDTVLNKLLSIPALAQTKILQPSVDVFSSAKSKTGKPPVLYVEAYLKNKEGILYFMSEGILFGFKKPILFYPKDKIMSISVNSITGRTFSLVLNLSTNESIEFSMIDTSEYQGISEYMNRFKITGPSVPSASSTKENSDSPNKVKKEPGNNSKQQAATMGGSSLNSMHFGSGDEDESDDEDFQLHDEESSDYASSSENDDGSQGSSSEEDEEDEQEEEEQEEEASDSAESESERTTVEEEQVTAKPSNPKKNKVLPKKTPFTSTALEDLKKPRLSGMAATAAAVEQQLRARRQQKLSWTNKGPAVKTETEIEGAKSFEGESIVIDDELDELSD